jgi:carboxyl-terminal processing protease
MRMSGVGRVVLPLLVVVGLVLGSVPPSAAAQAAIVTPAERANRIVRAGEVLEDAWDLLLDYFMEPIEPAALAEAADAGMRIALREHGVAPLPEPLAVVDGDRAGAWAALLDRYETLAARHDRVAPNELTEQGILAMAGAAHDPHTAYFVPEAVTRLQQATGAEGYAGIGARGRGPTATIIEVYAGSPAAAAGLERGDRILGVGDRPAPDLSATRSVELTCSAVGEPTSLTIQKAGNGELLDISLTCAEIHIPLVESRIVDGVGYVRLRSFLSYAIVDEVEQAVRSMQDAGVRGIVLDLRGNGGGYIEANVRILRRLVPDGPVYRMAERDAEPRVRDLCGPAPASRTGAAILQGRAVSARTANLVDDGCDGTTILTVPLAVLVDERSGSCSELFAVAIQESHAGRVFGTTTRGGLAVSLIVPLTDGSALQLGYAQMLSGAGRRINRVGVRPDEVVVLQLEDLWTGTDPQLARAVAYLQDVGARPAHILPLRSEQATPALAAR